MEQNQTSNLPALKKMLGAESIQKKFNEMLGKKASGFIASITTCVSNNQLLQKADPTSIVLAASQAAALDLPIVPNLGYAAIVPYKNAAQFQIMRNGWVELCERTGLVQTIVNEIVYEGQLVKKNKFTGEYVFDEDAKKSDKVIGYMAYLKLTNGFEKTVYWTVEECKAHGKRYSQTFKINKGLWIDDFNSMSLKTVLKNLIVKFAPKSVELQRAIEIDQAAFTGDIDNPQPVYVENQTGEVKEYSEYEEVNNNAQEQQEEQEQETKTKDSDAQEAQQQTMFESTSTEDKK